MPDIQDLDQTIDRINDYIEDMRSQESRTIKNSDLPTNLNIMLSGVSDSRALDFLFSTKLDVLVEKLLNMLESGNIEKILENEEQLARLFSNLGLGEGSFKGPVSKAILSNIQRSMDSMKFNKMKSKLGKIKLLLKNLKRQGRYIKDPETRRKYSEAIYAIRKVIKLVASIYRNRKIVSKRVLDGLSNIVTEDYMNEEALVCLEF